MKRPPWSLGDLIVTAAALPIRNDALSVATSSSAASSAAPVAISPRQRPTRPAGGANGVSPGAGASPEPDQSGTTTFPIRRVASSTTALEDLLQRTTMAARCLGNSVIVVETPGMPPLCEMVGAAPFESIAKPRP